MKRYVVKLLHNPSAEAIEDVSNSMYSSSYKLVNTIFIYNTMYLTFELDEVERRCN